MLYLEAITINQLGRENISLSEVESFENGKFLIQQLINFSTLELKSLSIFSAERTELKIDLRYLIPN